MSVPDILAATVLFLKADADVAALIDTRVYYEEVPKQQAKAWGRGDTANVQQAVVLRRSGAISTDKGRVGWQRQRMDAFCYGPTPFRAAEVELAVYNALKQMERNLKGDCLLQDAEVSGGALTIREPDTEWPLVLRSYVVTAAELAVV